MENIFESIRRLAAFDRALKEGTGVETTIHDLADKIMFEERPAARNGAIDELEKRLVHTFAADTLPASERIGASLANRMLPGVPKPTALDLADARKSHVILFEGHARAQDRVAVMRHLVNDQANTLQNRLSAYWLSPDAGPSDQDRLAVLRRIYTKQEAARKEFEAKRKLYEADKIKAPPRAPKLDYISDFNRQVKQDFRVQARRAGADAMLRSYEAKGYTKFLWVVVQGSVACPDCKLRAGVVGTLAYWRDMGLPGGGKTICGPSCYCMLVPDSARTAFPDLARPVTLNGVEPVQTSRKEEKALNSHRLRE